MEWDPAAEEPRPHGVMRTRQERRPCSWKTQRPRETVWSGNRGAGEGNGHEGRLRLVARSRSHLWGSHACVLAEAHRALPWKAELLVPSTSQPALGGWSALGGDVTGPKLGSC